MGGRFKKLKIAAGILVLAAALGVLFYSSPAISQQGALFSDQFNMNAYDWTPVNGQWQVVDGEYTETVDPDAQEVWSVGGQSLAWFDYTVEARVYSTDKGNNNPNDPDTISIAGRWADEKNYYALEYADTGSSSGTNFPRMTFYKKVNGLKVNLVTWNKNTNPVVPYIGEGNPPVIIKMKFVGANIDIYIDGVLLGSVTDTSLYYGKIAVGEYNRQVYFDEVYVWDAVPPRLFTPTVTKNVYNAVMIDFTTDEYTSYRVDYGETAAYNQYVITTLRELQHQAILSDLETGPTKHYHYKVTVTDAAGNTTSSGDFTFSTDGPPDLTGPTISEVVYSQVYATSAIVTFNTNELANSSIDYGLSPGAYKWSLSYDDIVTSHTLNLSRLEGQTKYYFRVRSRDIAGNSGFSPEYCLETLKDLKPKITKVTVGAEPSTNVAVYWKGVAGTVRYYVYISPDNNWGTPDATIEFTSPGTYSYQKSGLDENRNYFIRVIAEDETTSAASEARAFPPDNNPHGHYSEHPELCQNCHSTHDAQGARLISEVNPDRLCFTCHDGTQSKYDVLRGKFKGVDNQFYDSVAGPYGTLEGRVVEAAYEPTSRHDLNIFLYAATGNNIDNIEVADSHLSCSSCHDPHGQDNYRNLRSNLQVTLNSNYNVDCTAYSVTGATYEKAVYVRGAVDFCGGCHSDFNQGEDASRKARITTDQPGMTLSLASLNMYMHPVNIDAQYVTDSAYHVPVPNELPLEEGTPNGKIICQTCHFTHGTRNTGDHTRRDGYRSTVLKRFNQTVGCEECHDKTDHPDP